jgi:hypothetical protein
MIKKHNPILILFLFQITMQSKWKEIKRPKKLGFYFYFLPIKEELTKDAKRNYTNCVNARTQHKLKEDIKIESSL